MSTPDTKCEHDWQFIPAIELAVDSRNNLLRGENAECTKCGARTWAHGRTGNRPIITVFGTPTTGGK